MALLEQHSTKAAVIACIDFRFHALLPGALAKTFDISSEEYDDIKLAGGAGNLATIAKQHPERFQAVMDDIDLAISGHHITTVILLNHEQCGKYASLGRSFESIREERAFHRTELLQASQAVRSRFPHVEVLMGFVHTTQEDDVKITRVED